MPLRARLEARKETAQDFVLAAEERYWEGLSLIAQGREYAGVYLLGYAAEMYLKLAALHVDGLQPSDEIPGRLAPAKNWLDADRVANHRPKIKYEAAHSLVFWVAVLRRKRWHRGTALMPPLDSRLVQRVRRLYGIWYVQMRYRPGGIRPQEVRSAYDDVSWLRRHYRSLWR